MEDFNDDDFSDLYGDVEVQASSAISAMHVLTEIPLGDHGIFNHAMDVFPRLPDDEDDIFENEEEGNGFNETENATGFGGIHENATGVEDIEAEEKDENGGLTKLPIENDDNFESGSESESEDDLNIVLNGCSDGNKQQFEGNNSNINNFNNGIQFGVLNGRRKHEGGEEVEQDEKINGEGIYGRDINFFNGGDYDSQRKYIRHHPFSFPNNLRGNDSGDEDNICGQVMDESPVDKSESPVDKSASNFSLPRSRTIFDVNIDSFERKPWRHPKSDITNFFNFGFDEDGWKGYCSDVDQYREQKLVANRVLALKFSRHNKEHEVGSEHGEVTHDPVGNNTANSRKTKRSSPTFKIYHRGHLSELPKGSSIRSEDQIGKREPLSDERHSVDRDSDVVIQDLKEDSLNSVRNTTHPMVKKVHESSQGRDANVADDTNLLCFSSSSEDDQPTLGRNDDERGKIVSGRGSMHTLTCASVSLDLDKYGSVLISDSRDDNRHEVSDCDSDEMADTPDDSKRINASKIYNNVPSAVEPELSKTGRSRHDPSFSCSPSPCVALSNDDRQKSHEHSKKYGHHLSKESKSQSSKPSNIDSGYREKDGGPIGKELKQHKRSNDVHNLKTHLNDEDTSDMFVVRGHHDMHQSMTSRGKQKALINLDSNEKDMPYNKGSESLYAYFGGFFPDHHLGPAYMKNQYLNIHPSFRYEADWGNGHNLNENKNFLEKKRSKMDYEALEEDWYHNEKRHVLNKNPLNFDNSKKLIPKYSPYPVNRRGTQFSKKDNDMQFRRRRRGDNLSPLREHNNDFIKGKYRRYMPSSDRDRDYMNNRYDRNMPRDRRELDNHGRGKIKFRSPRNSSDYSWRMENEDNDMRCVKNRPFYKKPYYAGRGRFRGAARKKYVVPERHVRGLWKEKQKESGRYGSSNAQFDTNEGLRYHHDDDHLEKRRHYQQSINSFNNNGSIKNHHDQDHFIRRRHLQHSEESHWIDEEYEPRKPNDTMFGSPSYHFERISSNRKLDDRHASDHVAELISGREVDSRRYKLIREGGCSNQFDRSPKIINHDESHEQIHPTYQDSVDPPTYQDSVDPQLVDVGEKCTLQSSRRTPKAEDAVYYDGRYDFMEWDDDDEEPEDFNDFSPEEVDLSNEGKVDNADNQQIGFMDIEEGQIITGERN